MGIGIGSIGLAIGSIRGGIEGGGGSPGGGSSISGLARLDTGRSFGRLGPVNEGPVGLAALKLTVPLGEIKFGNEPLPAPSVPLETESAFFQAQKPTIFSPVTLNSFPVTLIRQPAEKGITSDIYPSLVAQDDNKAGPAIFPPAWPVVLAEPKIALNSLEYRKTQLVSALGLKRETKVENAVSALSAQAVATRPALQEEEVEERVQEKVKVEQPQEKLEREKVVKRRKYLVDQPVLKTVFKEAYQAYDKAKERAKELGLGNKVVGWLLAKLLPEQHEANTGGAVKPHGRDGTIPARKEAIAAKQEFASKKEVAAIILENRPVTIGENGEEAKKEEVSTTFGGYVVKQPKVIEIVRERIVKKKKTVPAVTGGVPVSFAPKQETEPKTGHTLKDLNLEGVLVPKAA